MTETTKAEILLNQVAKGNRLIGQLEAVKNHPIPTASIELSQSTKDKIQAFQEILQQHIEQLVSQREWIIGLVKQIPDQEIQLVLQLRYGLIGNSTTKVPWLDMPPIINYEIPTLYKRHRMGIDFLNVLLEQSTPPMAC